MPNVRIFAYIGSRALGDFIVECAVATTIKMNFESSSLIVYYRNDRWYKSQIIEMMPQIDFSFHASADKIKSFPIDCFDSRSGSTLNFNNENWIKMDGRRSDIILTSQSLNDLAIPSFERKSRFVIPENKQDSFKQKLIDLGLDKNRWFACLYWREPGYPGRTPHPFRDILDARPYIELAEHIVKKQGGQVVRLGHPGMTPMPKTDGIIDISHVENNVLLHAYAVSSARYFISSNSGPLSFGSAFGTPTLVTENTDPNGIWNEHDRSLGAKIIVNGKQYHQKAAFESGLMNGSLLKTHLASKKSNIVIQKCTAEELKFGADDFYERTKDVSGWRISNQPDNGVKTFTNKLELPLKPTLTKNYFLQLPNTKHEIG
jgi:putative glycosyltransferase (TIGR04372 family)